MMLASTLLALSLAQQPIVTSPDPRALAWQWHRARPSEAEILRRWQDSGSADFVLQAAARGLRGEAQLAPLLTAALGPPGSDLAPRSALLELLDAAPLDADARSRVLELQQTPQWRESATLALLRAGGDRTALGDYPAILETALGQNWLPGPGTWASFLQDERCRALLWPALAGIAVAPDTAAELAAIDTAGWPRGDRLLLDLVIADASAPTPESAALLWEAWLAVNLPEGAGIALQQALARHLPAADSELFGRTLATLDPARHKDAISMLALIAPSPAADALRTLSLDPSQATEVRARAANAVFRCGTDADVQALASLLSSDTPQPILQSVMAGMRLRPASGIATTLESMMPRLRTRLAGLAVELIVLTGNETQRLSWLDRMGPLQQSDQARIVQAAWAVAPGPSLQAWFEEQAASEDPSAAFRGRMGLQVSRTPAEVADFYRLQMQQAASPQARQAVLRAVRELRSDEALEVMVDWLATEEGLRHPTSSQWASLVVEEPAAERAFAAWWAQAAQLTPVQRDWAATHLVAVEVEARDHVRARILTAETAVQVRMWTALNRSPQAGDAELAFETLADAQAADPVRTRAAALIAQLAAQDAALGDRAWQLLTSAAIQNPQDVARAWRALMRSWAETSEDAATRVQLRARVTTLPTAWQVVLRRELGMGVATTPDEQAVLRASADLQEALQARFAPVDRGSAAAEQALTTETPALQPALLVLGASLDPETTAKLQASIAEQESAHPDVLAIAARSLEDRAPDLAASLRLRLRAIESRSSWRYPPDESTSALNAPWLLEANEAFRWLQEARESVGAAEQELVQLCLRRWPRDRRAHLWAGWYAWNEGRLGQAVRHFENAETCSGWLPYARMEPRLGLAMTRWRTDGSVASVRELLEELPQAVDVLPFRVPSAVEEELLNELSAEK